MKRISLNADDADYGWPLEDIPPEHAQALVSTRPRAESILRGFYRFLVIDRRIDRDPMDH